MINNIEPKICPSTEDCSVSSGLSEIKNLIKPILDKKVDAVLGSRFLKKINMPLNSSINIEKLKKILKIK